MMKMMVEVSVVEEVCTLYDSLVRKTKEAILIAIDIGERLVDIKQQLRGHDWTDWVDVNLPFGVRQAYKYIAAFKHKDEILLELKEGKKVILETAATTYITDTSEEEVDHAEKDRIFDNMKHRLESRTNELQRVSEQLEKLQGDMREFKKKAKGPSAKSLEPELERLRNRRDDLYAEVRGLEDAYDRIIDAREYFTRELLAIPALHVHEDAMQEMQNDVAALVGLVDNWSSAMKEKFKIMKRGIEV